MAHVLAQRYASKSMSTIWGAETRILRERQLWIRILKEQRKAGLDISEAAIKDYERAQGNIDLDAIHRIECKTHHDVKARIEAFNALAGHQCIHLGLTSRDLSENIEQDQIHRAARYTLLKATQALVQLSQKAEAEAETPLVGRTHNVPAQLTSLGKRLSCFGEELLSALENLESTLSRYRLRGLKGAVGNQTDLLRLLRDAEAPKKLEAALMEEFGIPACCNAVGQIYPRSLDFELIAALYQLGAPLAGFAKTLRLMAGHELMDEGFLPGQVGSSAMPHKVNCRSAERINSLHLILNGHLNMAAGLAGEQWNEGDVACSATRRVLFPDAFYTIDGMLEAFLNIIKNLRVHKQAIAAELSRTLPFLLTTAVLVESVKSGVGREQAHQCIKEHALAATEQVRSGKANDLLERLKAEKELQVDPATIDKLANEASEDLGKAPEQVKSFVQAASNWAKRFPEAAELQAEALL